MEYIKSKKKLFEKEWSGVALFMIPSPQYYPCKEHKKGLLSFSPLLFKNKKIIANIIVAALVVAFINIVGSYYFEILIDIYIPDVMNSALAVFSIGLICFYLLQQLLSYAQTYLMTVLGQRLTVDVILSYIRHLFKLPMSFFSTRRTGEIFSRFSDAKTIIDALASTIISVILDIAIAIIIAVVLGLENFRLFLFTLLMLPVYGVIVYAFAKSFERMNNEMMQANSVVCSSIIEDINGMETIKSLACEEICYLKIDHDFIDYLDKSFRYTKAENLQTVLKTGTRLVFNTLLLWYGSHLVINVDITIGQLVAYNALLGYFINPIINIINLQTKLQAAKVANNRLNEIFLIEAENNENKIVDNELVLDGQIILEHVSHKFNYGKKTLTNINLIIRPGEKLALVGMSGSGKSTLAKLLVNFYDVSEGNVRIGGINIKDINRNVLRRYINYLPQEPYIFSGSILDNLTLGVKKEISLNDIIRIADMVGIREVIENMPGSYATVISSDTTALSGGQKQRIALARALLTNASVLILDEATSNLDGVSEKHVLNNLMKLTDKTIIFIAHRLAISSRCDRIIVLDHGQIVEQGTHDELMSQNGTYYQIFGG